jgi:Tfp pilus assembly protein PilX
MKTKKGSALLLTTILMFIILSIVVSLTYVTVMEQKMSQKTKSSVGAFYGAESGIEWALNKIAHSDGTDTIATAFTGNIVGQNANCPFGTDTCQVYFLGADGKVLAPATDTISEVKAVRSVGAQGGETQRAIEAAVASGGIGKYQISCSLINGFLGCCRMDTESGVSSCKWTTDGYHFPWYYEKNGENW